MKTIGVVGGGQLARMLQPEITALGGKVWVLDPDPHAPAVANADGFVQGGYHDEAALEALARQVDVITVELEDVGVSCLAEISKAGTPVLPQPELIALIRDKLTQKQAYARLGLPTTDFVDVDFNDESAFEAFGYPLVQKARTGGYDGRGVAVLKGPEDFNNRLKVPCYIERLATFTQEVAVMVARGADGTMGVFDPVEMVADPQLNLLDLLLSPARLPPSQIQAAKDLAAETVVALDGVGLFGVELFVTPDGLLINEIAPRAHNSGHHTIEAAQTSQFGQQARLLCGLPLGSVAQPRPSALVNLVGAPGYVGETRVEGVQDLLAQPGVTLHLYGKQSCRPGRKMGHVSVVDDEIDAVLAVARRVKAQIKVRGDQEIK